jgi:hypothetical protein
MNAQPQARESTTLPERAASLSPPQLYTYDSDADLCRLFETVFCRPMGKTESLGHFQWEYRSNPSGNAVVFVIRNAEGEIVSAYPTMPLQMKLMSSTGRAGLSFDSMTDPRYKGRGLFTMLGKAVYAHLSDNRLILSYGFPNKNIHKLRVHRLGWFEITDFPLLLKVMDYRPLLSRIVPSGFPVKTIGSVLNKVILPFFSHPERINGNLTVEEIPDFDDEFDRFWNNIRALFKVCIERDTSYLRWRYGRPEETYKILRLRHSDMMAGYAVLKRGERFGLNTGFIMDFIVFSKDDYIRELLAAVVADFQKDRVEILSALLMRENPYYRQFRKAGFLPVPRRLHPQEIHFSARIHAKGGHGKDIRNPQNWFITWGDTDLL